MIPIPRALLKLWYGQHPLPIMFWGFYVGGFFLCFIVATIVLVVFTLLHLHSLGFGLGVALLISYSVVTAVGVWRSADAYAQKGGNQWGIAAKVVVGLWVARMIWGLANGGAAQLVDRITSS